jgi:anti-sigma regulatory factor (Ser/Thr protein kinase)
LTVRGCLEQEDTDVFVSTMRLPARSAQLSAARRYAEEAAAAFGLDGRGCFEFAVAANEAVTNALRHGAADADGQIHLGVLESADGLTFVVSDYGRFTAPVADPGPTSEGGRGFTLMTTLVDTVEVHSAPEGTTIRLTKLRA